jgi:hypothetical protein
MLLDYFDSLFSGALPFALRRILYPDEKQNLEIVKIE